MLCILKRDKFNTIRHKYQQFTEIILLFLLELCIVVCGYL